MVFQLLKQGKGACVSANRFRVAFMVHEYRNQTARV